MGVVGDHRLFGVAHRVEGEGADAVEQPVTRPGDGVIGDQERPCGQPSEHVDRRRWRNPERREHELGGGQDGTTGERRQRPQPPLVVREQQVVAPGDRRPQCPATIRPATRRVVQHHEAVVETLRDLLDRQGAGPRGRQFDRQRQTVQRPAQHPEVLVVVGRPATPRRPLGEQHDGIVDVERCQFEHGRSVEAERRLAGAQDAHVGDAVDEPSHPVGGRVEHVFAVVDDQQCRRGLQAFDERHFTARDSERGDGRVDHLRLRGGTLQPNEPHAPRLRDHPADRQCQRGLADAARTDHLDQPMVMDELLERRGLRLAADQPRRERRQVAVPRPDVRRPGRIGQPSVVGEDLLFEFLQFSTGHEAELVGERRANPPVRAERVGLSPCLVEGRDQQCPQAFLERLLGHDAFEVGDHLLRLADPHSGGTPQFQQLQPRGLQPCPVRLHPGPVAGIDQHVAGEEAQRRGAQVDDLSILGFVEQPPRCDRRFEHDGRVDLGVVDDEAVAAVDVHDEARVTQRPPEPGDLRLQRVRPRRGGVITPEVLQQPITPNGDPGLERQADQQFGRLAGRNPDRIVAAVGGDWSEHRDRQHVRQCRNGVTGRALARRSGGERSAVAARIGRDPRHDQAVGVVGEVVPGEHLGQVVISRKMALADRHDLPIAGRQRQGVGTGDPLGARREQCGEGDQPGVVGFHHVGHDRRDRPFVATDHSPDRRLDSFLGHGDNVPERADPSLTASRRPERERVSASSATTWTIDS